jgi:hypothetical protein
MARFHTRRAFLEETLAVGVLAASGTAESRAGDAKMFPICVTCGSQFASSADNPRHCPICEDQRQYVGHQGQQWTTLEKYRLTHKNIFAQEEDHLHSIHPQPRAGIGQRAFLVQTEQGNLLWDCIPPLDEPTLAQVKTLGGLAGIAVSHPHYYCTMVEWSHAFGKVPIYLHARDRQWVMRPDPVIAFWEGVTKPIFGGLTLVNTEGHFDGYQVLHWPAGAAGKGVLLSGDQPYVCQDRRWVSFMYSYPNLIPLRAGAIRRIAERLEPLAFERIYGAFPEQAILSDARGAVLRSGERYQKAIRG